MDREVWAEQTESGMWRDQHGFVGPLRPGTHARTNPVGDFPTGPAVGARLPDVVAPNHDGRVVDVHAERDGGPLVMVFYRSAVW